MSEISTERAATIAALDRFTAFGATAPDAPDLEPVASIRPRADHALVSLCADFRANLRQRTILMNQWPLNVGALEALGVERQMIVDQVLDLRAQTNDCLRAKMRLLCILFQAGPLTQHLAHQLARAIMAGRV